MESIDNKKCPGFVGKGGKECVPSIAVETVKINTFRYKLEEHRPIQEKNRGNMDKKIEGFYPIFCLKKRNEIVIIET